MTIEELKRIARQQALNESFGDVITMKYLRDIIGLSETAIYNAIIREKLVCMKVDADEGEKGGFWIISRKSARKLWPQRFESKGL